MGHTPELLTDILRKIVVYSDHSIRELRRTNRAFKDLVEDEFSKFCNMPRFDEMLITVPEDEPGSVVSIILKIHKPLGFVLRKLSERNLGFGIIESEKESMETAKKSVQLEEMINNPENVSSTAKQFKRVKKVILKGMGGGINKMVDYFCNVRCTEFFVDDNVLTTEISEEIIKLAHAWEPAKVTIDIAEHSLVQQRDFLVELAEVVDDIHIVQRNYFEAASPSYLFDDGVQDPWLDILSDMFSKRVSRIRADHDNRRIIANRLRFQRFLDEIVIHSPGKNVVLEMNAFYNPFVRSPFPFKVRSADLLLKVSGANSVNKNCQVSVIRQPNPTG